MVGDICRLIDSPRNQLTYICPPPSPLQPLTTALTFPLPFQSLLSLLSIWEKVSYRSCADGCTGGAASGRTAATGGGLGRAVAPLLGEGLVAGGRRALLGFR